MAKYYVQSGPIRTVMDAQDIQGAALWAMHSVLGEISFIYEERSQWTDQQRFDQVLMHAMIELEPTVRVSERGFDRTDAIVLETFDLAVQWHQLATALSDGSGLFDQ